MYTIKTLSDINPNYCYSHKVTQVDVDNVNAMVEAIEKEREGVITPQVGDVIQFTDRHGMYYYNALLLELDKWGDGKSEICYSPFVPSVSADGGKIHLAASGGPFGYHDPADLVYRGDAPRRFCIWGVCGPEADGSVEFDARVHLWSYREPNPFYGDYSTKDWDMFYVSHNDKPMHGSRYRYRVSMPGGTAVTAFVNDTEYLSWLRTYRGVEFKGSWEQQIIVFCYRVDERLISKDEWDALALPTDTRCINCSTILVKVDYDDIKHVVKEYRYENRGTLDSEPYRTALMEMEKNPVKRVILPRTAE